MQFHNSSSRELSLYADAQDRAGADSNAFTIAAFTRYCNRHYYRAVLEAWKAQDTWRFDDSNQSSNNDDDAGKPVATSTLVNSQKVYTLPTGALRIRRVEVKDVSGDWQVVRPISERQITHAEEEFFETDGLPLYYVLEGDTLRLFPAPDNGVSVTLTNGLRIFFDREVDEFTVSDTTQEPGLPEPFHHILSVGAAYDFCSSKGKPQAGNLRQELELLHQQLREFFSGRQQDQRLKMRPKRTSYA